MEKETGCVCCGFGLNYEIRLSKKRLDKNRIELLYQEYPNLYNKYIHDYDMKEPFSDLGYYFDIHNSKYKQLFVEITKKRKKGYANLKHNLLKIISRIEKRKNGKFKPSERQRILKIYGIN